MVVCTNATKPLELEDIPELRTWRHSFDLHPVRDIKFRTTRPPVPPFPKSEDYLQFRGLMGQSHDFKSTLMMFKELFNLDSEDNITGASMVFSDWKLRSTLAEEPFPEIEYSFRAVQPEDWLTKYNKISPWVGDILRDVGPWPEDHKAYKRSRYDIPVRLIGSAYDRLGYGFYYMGALVQEAVKHNFPEGHPDRALLVESTEYSAEIPPTETLRWYEPYYDYNKTFDPETLVRLKPALLAYLKDLKNLARGDDRS